LSVRVLILLRLPVICLSKNLITMVLDNCVINENISQTTFAAELETNMRNIYTLLFALIIVSVASAQEDTTQARDLSEVVITGQYKPQSVKKSVYQVRTITKERIQQQGASKLQDVLNTELNIRFSQDPATGGSDISMLGLSGQNVKILVDGLPMVGRQGTSNEININQIDVNTIERIEIIEGPMSVVYGADALAGVINIITKKAGTKGFSVTARIQEETIGKEYGIKQGIHNQYAGLSWKNKKWELGGGIGYNYFGGWKDTALDRELVWHLKDQITGNAFIGFATSKFNIRYRFDGLDEIIYNPGNFTQRQEDADDTLAFDQEYLSQRLMQQLQASYFVNSGLSFQAQASYSDYSRQVFSTQVSKKTGRANLNPSEASQSLVEFTGFTFRGTAQVKFSPYVSLQPGVDINLETGKGERMKTGTNEVNDYAFFITSEFTPTSRINIRPGLRFIKNSIYDAPPLIPSINTKFVLSKELDLRLAYARGFRSPSLRELYFNFFDANHQIIGNPDLQAETSNSFTGSLSWKKNNPHNVKLSAVLSGFYNDIENMIDYALSPSDPNVFVYMNVDKFKSRGASLTGNLGYKAITASLGVGYTGRYNSFTELDKSLPSFKWSPEINSTIGYNFSKIGLTANLFYKFIGKLPYYQLVTVNGQDEIRLSQNNSYNLADLTLNKKLFRYFTINAGIKNLFDVDFVNSSAAGGSTHTTSGARAIAYGRSYFAGLVFNWEKNKK
jgi:outer membrane receptor for ferrienterochelin and colicins